MVGWSLGQGLSHRRFRSSAAVEHRWLKSIYQQSVYHKTQGIGFDMRGLQPLQYIVIVHFEQMKELNIPYHPLMTPSGFSIGTILKMKVSLSNWAAGRLLNRKSMVPT